jgi:hypothetical protein
MEEVMLIENDFPREDAKDSHIIHINIITDANEIKDPRDEMIFQVVKASG